MSFAEKLRQLRVNKDMSLAEFADLLGTSKQVLSRYERGENTPKITTVQKYADILNVPLSFLTDEEEDRHDTSPIIKEITEIVSNMSDEELAKVSSYIRFIKSGG